MRVNKNIWNFLIIKVTENNYLLCFNNLIYATSWNPKEVYPKTCWIALALHTLFLFALSLQYNHSALNFPKPITKIMNQQGPFKCWIDGILTHNISQTCWYSKTRQRKIVNLTFLLKALINNCVNFVRKMHNNHP